MSLSPIGSFNILRISRYSKLVQHHVVERHHPLYPKYQD